MSEDKLKGKLYKFIEDKEQSIEDYYSLTVYSDEMLTVLDKAKAEIFSCLSDINVSKKYPTAYHILEEDKLIETILKWFGSE